uniref:Photosystem I reaction center subunit XII n=1 Tax=Apophlaea sinclairii TaxID=212746 RepID=A0A1C9CBS3_9FLOR|nr:photosystem I subunit XII [Apophlaea sinclairii]AOM65809.1 photosystem I subunit XII [Apophlaea sinclairii]
MLNDNQILTALLLSLISGVLAIRLGIVLYK